MLRFTTTIMSGILACGVAAQNLVPNAGFELVTDTIEYYGQLHLAPPWWNQSNGGTDLYNDSCGVLGLEGSAHSGHGCAGEYLILELPNLREYMEVPLLAPLQAGVSYCVSFFVNPLFESYPLAVDRVGAYFSVDSLDLASGLIPVIPQVEHPAGVLLADTGWHQVSGAFTAMGGEAFMTIGNFRDDANTLTQSENPDIWWFDAAYYLIDDVEVSPVDAASACGKVGVRAEREVRFEVYPQPAVDAVYVRVPGASTTCSFQLIDLLGHTWPLRSPAREGEDTRIIDLSGTPSGTYVLVATTGSTTWRTVIVVQ